MTRYGRPDRKLEDAVFFYVDIGSGAADSALAICRELQRRGSTMALYWGVSGLAVPVPAGVTPIQKFSREWFEKLNSSRFIVNNYGGVGGLVKHADQRYLQTWHGTPYKFIGVSEARQNDPSPQRLARIAQEAAVWDGFVSPSPYMSEIARRELLYHGPVLEVGYPRNDRLVSIDPREADALREKLGLRRDARVLLYAPTYREHQRQGWRAELFDGLDLDLLLDLLGSEWQVLLRGHSFNARNDHTDQTRGRVLDVTRHPDINDLYLVADLLVTDYSSVMFDFSVTGKPIAYFTPDLEPYIESRGVYLELAQIAPGPLYRTVSELGKGIRALDALSSRYREKYSAFRERFAPWDDGKAAARVVDAFFD
jgi:CDP-glycerol glycerophosphotransferase